MNCCHSIWICICFMCMFAKVFRVLWIHKAIKGHFQLLYWFSVFTILIFLGFQGQETEQITIQPIKKHWRSNYNHILDSWPFQVSINLMIKICDELIEQYARILNMISLHSRFKFWAKLFICSFYSKNIVFKAKCNIWYVFPLEIVSKYEREKEDWQLFFYFRQPWNFNFYNCCSGLYNWLS